MAESIRLLEHRLGLSCVSNVSQRYSDALGQPIPQAPRARTYGVTTARVNRHDPPARTAPDRNCAWSAASLERALGQLHTTRRAALADHVASCSSFHKGIVNVCD